MYQLFKISHCKEMYIEILPEQLEKALFHFRIGTHKLPFNNRKNSNVPMNERIYTICDEVNVHNFTRMLHTSEPDKINNLATFILYGLKLYGQ